MKRILVALDSSPRAPLVLTAAVRLAELTDAKLIVYRAVGIPPDMPLDIFNVTDDRLEDLLVRNASASLDRMVHDLPPGRVEKVLTTFATAWDGICRVGKEEMVDLVVIGAHGYHGLDRVLGTTAAKVVNHAERNVLVVRTEL